MSNLDSSVHNAVFQPAAVHRRRLSGPGSLLTLFWWLNKGFFFFLLLFFFFLSRSTTHQPRFLNLLHTVEFLVLTLIRLAPWCRLQPWLALRRREQLMNLLFDFVVDLRLFDHGASQFLDAFWCEKKPKRYLKTFFGLFLFFLFFF